MSRKRQAPGQQQPGTQQRAQDEAQNKKRELARQIVSWWGSPVVARSQISKLTGGALSPRTLANLEALGQGPPPSARLRGPKKAIYITELFVRWFLDRYELAEEAEGKEVAK